MGDYSPEKAGVGGSIPSLATMFSISYSQLKPKVCSILFHNPGSSECASHLETKRNRLGDGMQRELFYVAASRGRETVQVITSDKELLRDSVARSAARQSASELARKVRPGLHS